MPEAWSFVSLEKNHVIRLEPDGTVTFGSMWFSNQTFAGEPRGEVFEVIFQGKYSLEESLDSQPAESVWEFTAHFDAWGLWEEREWEGTLLGGILTVRTGESIATFEKRR